MEQEMMSGPEALTALQQAYNGIDDAYWNGQPMEDYIAQAETALAALKEYHS